MKVFITADIGFGDAGKGTIVEALTRRYQAHTVVRYNGGPQAAHNVVLKDGRHHNFSQFGSGTLSGSATFLSHFMLVDPVALLNEAEHLIKLGVNEPLKKMFIDKNAKIIHSHQKIANQLREKSRGENAHGSCGMGIGECQDDSINHNLCLTVGDLKKDWEDKYQAIRQHKIKQFPDFDFSVFSYKREIETLRSLHKIVNVVDQDWLDQRMKNGVTVFEGAQGVLLDEWHGFHPYTTWSNITFENAEELLKNYAEEKVRVGIVRSHMIRHGAGPFPTEDNSISIKEHNRFGEWQKNVRYGWLDFELLRYSINALHGIDELAVTHLDQIPLCDGYLRVCNRYENMRWNALPKARDEKRLKAQEETTKKLRNVRPVYSEYADLSPNKLCEILQQELKSKVSIRSFGQTYDDKIL